MLDKVLKVAELSRLQINEKDSEKYQADFEQILGYVEQLTEIDTEGVEPVSHALEIFNVYREDHAQHELSSEEVFQNAPESENSFFKVPQMMESE